MDDFGHIEKKANDRIYACNLFQVGFNRGA